MKAGGEHARSSSRSTDPFLNLYTLQHLPQTTPSTSTKLAHRPQPALSPRSSSLDPPLWSHHRLHSFTAEALNWFSKDAR